MAFLDSTNLPEAPEDDFEPGLLVFSRGTAILLLFVYVAYLYFEVLNIYQSINFLTMDEHNLFLASKSRLSLCGQDSSC